MDSFTIMTLLNGLIAAAYYTIADYLAPRLTLPKPGALRGDRVLCAVRLTHSELAVRGLRVHPA